MKELLGFLNDLQKTDFSNKESLVQLITKTIKNGLIPLSTVQEIVLSSYRENINKYFKEGLSDIEIKEKIDNDEVMIEFITNKLNMKLEDIHLIIQEEIGG